jgi:hypothetical protein
MKRAVTKIGVYLYNENESVRIYCGDVWEADGKWVGVYCKSKPRKKAVNGDYYPRVNGESQQEVAARLANIVQKEQEVDYTRVRFGEPKKRTDKTIEKFTFV